jgi:septal ring factor EnvC (AmiA/AmiB activator)
LSQPEPPRGPEPPLEPVDDAAPATVGELRSLRRWLVVAGVWAVAASAIAIIALLSANNNDQPKRSPGAVTGAQLTGVQRDLDQRIDALEKKAKSAPSSSDVSKLEDRLKTVEDRSDSTRSDLKAVRSDLDDLKKRVDDVEKQQQDNAGTGGTGTDTTTTP